MWWDKIKFKSDGTVSHQGETFRDGMIGELLLLWAEISEILSKYLDLPLSDHELLTSAAVICNPYEGTGAIWPNMFKKYGTQYPAKAVERLEAARSQLEKIRIHESRGGRCNPEVLDDVRTTIRDASGFLWRDVRFRVSLGSHDQLQKVVDLLIAFLDAGRIDSSKNAQKKHPYYVAVALRAVFERYSTKRISSGHGSSGGTRIDGSTFKEKVSGQFGQCLAEIYEVSGAENSARYYADKAKKLDQDDELLVNVRLLLAGASGRMIEFRFLFEQTDTPVN